MRMIDIQGLRDWSAQRGLFWHEEWPQRPAFGPDAIKIAWPWPRPHGWTRPWQLAEFLLASVRAVSFGEPGGWYLWPRNGRWTAGGSQPYYRVRDALLGGIGIHAGDQGAALFEGSEGDALAAAIFACCFMFDDCEGTASDHFDVFPLHGQLGLYFVDEEMYWATTATKEPLERFNRELVQAGWDWLRDESKNDFVWPAVIEELPP
jgi:hypothetical protein